MSQYRLQIFIASVFAFCVALVLAAPAQYRADIIYIGQFLALAPAFSNLKRRPLLTLAVASLMFADLLYYLIVYKFGQSTGGSWFMAIPTLMFGLSFSAFTILLSRDRMAQLIKALRHRSNLPVGLFFLAVAIAYISLPGAAKLLGEGLRPAHISFCITLTCALPLVMVAYLHLAHSSNIWDQIALAALFILGILDFGIQIETILNSNLDFSNYDILWFFAVAALGISLRSDSFQTPLRFNYSVINLTKKVFFLAALGIIVLGVFFIPNISPRYFVFLLISLYVFGILCAIAIQLGIERYNRQLLAFQSVPSDANFDRVLDNSPVEFRNTLFEVLHRSVENELNSIEIERKHLTALSSVYRHMAHDIASPLSVLQLLSKSAIELDDERKEVLGQALRRVKEIADDVLNRNTGFQGRDSAGEALSVSSLVEVIVSLAKEKNIEFDRPIVKVVQEVGMTGAEAVNANARELGRVLSNLINNSAEVLEESSAGPKIELRISRAGNFCRIEVRDNGPGFSAELLSAPFEPRPGLRKRGHGIGLPAAAATVHKWMGNLSLFNQGGAVARVDLRIVDAGPSIST
jgi:signal transduction histidine kinase